MRFYVAVVAIAVAGCGSGSDSQSPSASATATSAAQTPHVSRPAASTPVPATPSAIALAPNCRNGLPPPQIVQAQHADDGVPDPAGRIVFGRLTRVDDGLGQLVSINAIDPDGSDLTQVLDCETERPGYSHDGTRLVFSIAMNDGMYQVATSAVDGSDLR